MVDPISGYDALCAVLADKMDVLTGSPLLPTGRTPLIHDP